MGKEGDLGERRGGNESPSKSKASDHGARDWKVRRTPLARQILFYVAMALIPVVIFGLLLFIAKH